MQLSGEDWFGVKNAKIYGFFIKKIAKFLKVKKFARNVHTYLKRKYLQPQCAIVHPYSPSACFERDSGCSGWKRSSLSSHSSKCKPGGVMRRQMAKMVVDRITSSEDATAQSGSQTHLRNLTINSPDKLEWNEQNRKDAYALISL